MTWRERMKRRLFRYWWRFKFGEPPSRFAIGSGGLRPQHLALLLPPDFHDFDVAQRVLLPLVERMNPKHTTILVRENFRTWLPTGQGWQIVTFDSTARGFLGFPKPDVLHKLEGLLPDVLVDLTPSFSAYTAALATGSGAPLRISLDVEQEGTFYNFFIEFDGSSTLAERYNALLRYV